MKATIAPIAGVLPPQGELTLDDASVVVGRARVHRGRLGARDIDAYVFAPEDGDARVLVARLVSFGKAGLGGVVGGGRLDAQFFAVCMRPARTAADIGQGEKLAGERVLALLERFGGALATAESASLDLGPLRPADFALDDDGAFVVADALVRSLVGETASRSAGGTGPSPRWTPPEQANGATWDAAANRYVLGLIAYRLISGEHPFSGAGMRTALEAQAREAPPFEDEVAKKLRPGVQAFLLSLLHPRLARRPKSAASVVTTVQRLRSGAASEVEGEKAQSAAGPANAAAERRVASAAALDVVARPRRTFATSRATTIRAVAVVASGAVAISAWAITPSAAPKAATDLVPTRGPVTSRSADACAPCHATQVEEWRRSVMAFSSRSPLYRALESAVEEQVGKDNRCPSGAGILRKRGAGACVDPASNLPVTGSGGEHWCVHCHAPLDQLGSRIPAWNGSDLGSRGARPTLGDALAREGTEGITCVACHTSVGPVEAHARRGRGAQAYEGNPTWTSPRTGVEFPMRPEDTRGLLGISNSGYRMEPGSFFAGSIRAGGAIVHDRPTASARAYLASSEFCGSCHDVRLFGSDVLGARDRGEHFKRLRNAYSEWKSWSDAEARAGRRGASCQECHMSTYPGLCKTGAPRRDLKSEGCPPGTGFVATPSLSGDVVAGSRSRAASHYFTGVEVPFANEFPERYASDRSLDADGVPVGLRARRDMLLRSAFSFALGQARIGAGGSLELPVEITNVGAGHRVPAGFSQEREFWVELRVTDARGSLVYEVGRVERPDQDLADKRFLRVRVDDASRDAQGRPLGVFGADIADGPDVGRWSPNPSLGGTSFRGQGLINFQNGFLRCVRCIGVIALDGSCQPEPGQGATRADRFEDGDYDADSGECRSNLSGGHELFETYFPVGGLDADRGVLRAPDAIIDTRSAPPGVPLRYTYVIAGAGARQHPLRAEARLRFRAFPPFLIRAFVAYERDRAGRGERPSGPQMTEQMLEKLEIVDLATSEIDVP